MLYFKTYKNWREYEHSQTIITNVNVAVHDSRVLIKAESHLSGQVLKKACQVA